MAHELRKEIGDKFFSILIQYAKLSALSVGELLSYPATGV